MVKAKLIELDSHEYAGIFVASVKLPPELAYSILYDELRVGVLDFVLVFMANTILI